MDVCVHARKGPEEARMTVRLDFTLLDTVYDKCAVVVGLEHVLALKAESESLIGKGSCVKPSDS